MNTVRKRVGRRNSEDNLNERYNILDEQGELELSCVQTSAHYKMAEQEEVIQNLRRAVEAGRRDSTICAITLSVTFAILFAPLSLYTQEFSSSFTPLQTCTLPRILVESSASRASNITTIE
jgi:hypothetical protein